MTYAAVGGATVDSNHVFLLAERKLQNLLKAHPGQAPVFTTDGCWNIDQDAWAPAWTAGFLAGLTWLVAERTHDDWWREQAEQQCLRLEHRKHDNRTHDIGFLFTPSWGRWHTLQPSERTREVLATAGRTMAARYNPNGRYLSTWVGPASTFIDVMMNIDIIYEAAEICGDPRLADVATQHALTSRRHLVRGDGTTVHEGIFDPDTGEFLRASTHQGHRADSSWVRGHAWGMYGFTSAYARTGDDRFLHTARALADAYLNRSTGRLPPNDWEAPQVEPRTEVSAASVAAAGLARLADLDESRSEPYRVAARALVATLAQPAVMPPDPSWEGLVRPATYHASHGLGVNESVMWGDYYFLEAVDLTTRPDHDHH